MWFLQKKVTRWRTGHSYYCLCGVYLNDRGAAEKRVRQKLGSILLGGNADVRHEGLGFGMTRQRHDGRQENLISTLLRRKVIILGIEERFHQFDRILDDCHRFLGHLFECFAIFSDSIGQLYSFQVGPNEFIGIEFGGIRRDACHPQPFPCFGTQKGTGFIRFMPARIVPNQ